MTNPDNAQSDTGWLAQVQRRARTRQLRTLVVIAVVAGVGIPALMPLITGSPAPAPHRHHPSDVASIAIAIALLAAALAVLVVFSRRIWRGEGRFAAPLEGGLPRRQRRQVTRAVRTGQPGSDPQLLQVEQAAAERTISQGRRALTIYLIATAGELTEAVTQKHTADRIFFTAATMGSSTPPPSRSGHSAAPGATSRTPRPEPATDRAGEPATPACEHSAMGRPVRYRPPWYGRYIVLAAAVVTTVVVSVHFDAARLVGGIAWWLTSAAWWLAMDTVVDDNGVSTKGRWLRQRIDWSEVKRFAVGADNRPVLVLHNGKRKRLVNVPDSAWEQIQQRWQAATATGADPAGGTELPADPVIRR